MSWSLMGLKELNKHSVVKHLEWQRETDGFTLTGQNNRFELRGTEKIIW